MSLGDARPAAFGTRSDDGRYWWNGYLWQVVPDAFVEQPPVHWPPPGYYQRPMVRRVTHWDGTDWGTIYWRWWRVVATLTVGIIGGLATIYFMGGMLGDPGSGGNTQSFEDSKDLGTVLFLVCGTATAALLLMLTRSGRRSPVDAAARHSSRRKRT